MRVASPVYESGDAASAERLYDVIWRDGLEATTRVGATISHHHGVGLLKAPFMAAEHREAMAVFEAAKAALDPDGILNPGKMGLGKVGLARRGARP
jgi:alkyldihydroxyacetonephosphate synthase